jgi:hypothetical protein
MPIKNKNREIKLRITISIENAIALRQNPP